MATERASAGRSDTKSVASMRVPSVWGRKIVRGLLKRIALAGALSWLFAASLGLLYAAHSGGGVSVQALMLPAVIPVTLIGSTVAAIIITPFAIWSVRAGKKNLIIYGPILWIALAVWVLAMNAGAHNEEGAIVLAAVGLIIFGFIPVRK